MKNAIISFPARIRSVINYLQNNPYTDDFFYVHQARFSLSDEQVAVIADGLKEKKVNTNNKQEVIVFLRGFLFP